MKGKEKKKKKDVNVKSSAVTPFPRHVEEEEDKNEK